MKLNVRALWRLALLVGALASGGAPRPGSVPSDPPIFALLNEVSIIEHLARNRLERVLPEGLRASHFVVLNHLVRLGDGRSLARIARAVLLPANPSITPGEKRARSRSTCTVSICWVRALENRPGGSCDIATAWSGVCAKAAGEACSVSTTMIAAARIMWCLLTAETRRRWSHQRRRYEYGRPLLSRVSC